MPRELTPQDVVRVRERLRPRARVFDDPASYRAGVDEALRGLVEPAGSTDAESAGRDTWHRPA